MSQIKKHLTNLIQTTDNNFKIRPLSLDLNQAFQKYFQKNKIKPKEKKNPISFNGTSNHS